MVLTIVLMVLLLAGASFAVQRTSRAAEKPGKWSRNGLLGLATISMMVMTGLVYGERGTEAFLMLAVWLPATFAGILVERASYRAKRD